VTDWKRLNELLLGLPKPIITEWGISLGYFHHVGVVKAGELRASNLAEKQGTRPRWRVAPQALAEFLESREQAHTMRAKRTKRSPQRDYEVFFPPSSSAG
jgi:hypothetical protein